MALSAKNQTILAVALSSKVASAELVKIVNARAGTPSRVLTQSVVDAMAGKGTGEELLAALVSGATLSVKAQKKVLIMMAGDATPSGGMEAAGNDLINFIQTTPLAKKVVL